MHLGIRHDKSEPNRHESNGVVERHNRTVIEGTRAVLYQSGLPYKYWPLAMKYFCVAHNFWDYDKKHGHNPYNQRHGTSFKGECLIVGEGVEYRPNAAEERGLLRKLDPVTIDGIFVGYVMDSNSKWTGRVNVTSKSDYCSLQGITNLRDRP